MWSYWVLLSAKEVQNHSECLGLKLFVEDAIRMRRRDMHVGEDKWREHEKDIQGSSGFEDKGYIWPQNLVSDQNIRIFLQLKDVQVYQIAIHPCTRPLPKVGESCLLFKNFHLLFLKMSWQYTVQIQENQIRFPAFFWRIHAYVGPPKPGLPIWPLRQTRPPEKLLELLQVKWINKLDDG